MNIQLYAFLNIFIIVCVGEAAFLPKNTDVCSDVLPTELIEEIAAYQDVANKILQYVSEGEFKGRTYDESDSEYYSTKYCTKGARDFAESDEDATTPSRECGLKSSSNKRTKGVTKHRIEENIETSEEFIPKKLAKFVDKFGARPSGTEVLENSIDYMIQLTRDEDIHNIVTEELEVPHWERGEEKITMIEPRHKNIPLLGLGKSVSTPSEGLQAEVIVFQSFDEFDKTEGHNIEGKILLFNPIFTTYGETVTYRSQAAAKAAGKGAIASLVRSIAPFSINSPHTGSQYYDETVTKIPTAAITIEDADMINRMYKRGEKVVLNIQMQSTFETKTSRNTLIDYKGIQNPEKLVIVSGHIDSWDVGQGAMDDGGGLFISWAVPVILNRLNLRPKRTIRSIFWTAEELGLIGAYAYEKRHRNESDNINFIMESDEGTFAPLGLAVAGNQEARCIVAEVLKLFQSINASTLVEDDNPGSDIAVVIKTGIPGASLYNANDKYFWFHHTEGDTMTVEDEHELDLGAAFWTAVAYIIADISVDIPR